MTKTVTIFGSANPKDGDRAYETARELGRSLAKAGFTICNGGYGGTMEATARGAKESGGTTIGVTAEFFSTRPNRWIDKNIVVKTLLERLWKLIELGDAYVVLGGGTGTLLELASVWELINKGAIKEKPIIVIGKLWKDITTMIKDELIREDRAESTRYVITVDSPSQCVDLIKKKLLTTL